MATGFYRVVSANEIRGWAYEPSRPRDHLTVRISCGERVIGQTQAHLYRPDLEVAGIGEGDHAFVLYCDPPLKGEELGSVFASLVENKGSHRLQRLERESDPQPAPAEPMVEWPRATSDVRHHPVFILGSARSGTSAVTQALLTATSYKGYQEGHLFDVLAPLTVALNDFLRTKADERDRNTTAARISRSFVDKGLDDIMVAAARELFPGGLWLDKTPNTNMIHLAPRFLQIWPNAKFVFMKRRGVENVASRLRKFDYDFAQNCHEWASAMESWLTVRDHLAGSSLEVDQATAAREPGLAATQLAELLSLSDKEQRRIEQILASERVQQTGDAAAAARPLRDMGWRADWVAAFREICGPMMKAFGYTE